MDLVNKISSLKTQYNDAYQAGMISTLQGSKHTYPVIDGEVICIDDMANVEHQVLVSKKSKNLLTRTPIRALKTSFADCMFLPQGVYTLSMTFQNATSWRFTVTLYDINGKLITDTTVNPSHFKGISHILNYSSGNGGIYQNAENIKSNSMTVETDSDYYIGVNFYFGDTTSETIANNAQLEIGTVATSYHPPVDNLDAAKIYKYGKNIVNLSPLMREYSGRYYNGYSCVTEATKLRGKRITYQAKIDFTDTIEKDTASGAINFRWLDENKTLLYTYFGTNVYAKNGDIYTVSINTQVPDTAYYIGFGVGVFFNSTATPAAGSIIRLSEGQVEISSAPTDYEPYKTPVEVDGAFDSSPEPTVLISDTLGVSVNCQYLRDVDKYIDNLGIAMAMSGGAT